MTNKYFEIIKKTTVNYIENKISVEVFEETFQKLDEIEIYKNLENDGYKSVSNFVSAVQEIDDLGALKSQWIVKIIDLFYAYFTDNYDYIYSKDFYKFFKFGLNKETKNPVKKSFKQAIQNYLNKKISSECLAYTANEFLNNLKFFQEEINKDKELSNLLNMSLKLKFNKFLEDLNPKETQTKKTIDNVLKNYIKNN